MNWIKQVFSRRQIHDDLSEEIQQHLDERADELVRGGMSRDKARAKARREFGNVTLLKQGGREVWQWPLVENLWRDLRYAFRQLRRSPSFTLIAVLSLTLGIGANTAIFSLLDQVLLRTLPVRNPGELVYLYSEGPWEGDYSADEPGGAAFSYPAFREMQREPTPLVGLAGAHHIPASLAFNNQASHGYARLVSGNYFELLGVRPAIGRLLTESDDQNPGAGPRAVLGYDYWSSRFGANVAVLNQTMLVNNYPMTIVGVTRKGFLSERQGHPPDIYLPLSMKREVTPGWDGFADPKDAWFTLFGRLKPGVTLEQAEAEIDVVYRAQMAKIIPLLGTSTGDFLTRFRARKITLKSGPGPRGGLRDFYRKPLLLLMGLTFLVLLISCVNVANLQLARGAVRAREVSARLALGASRMQIVRQFLTESCLLAIAGGVLGILAAHWTIRAILAAIPPSRNFLSFLTATIDSRMLLFCLGLSMLTGIVFGLFPALQASRINLAASMKDGAAQISSTGSVSALRKLLVGAQVAVSLLLLISAGLFGQTLLNLKQADLGIRVDHLMTFGVMPHLSQYTPERSLGLAEQLSERLAAIPGVSLVSAARIPAIADSTSRSSFTVEGSVPGDNPPRAYTNWVGVGYFRTMGMALVAGREFTRADDAASRRVVVVNETFVERFLPNRNPLGVRIDSNGEKQIVGVVSDANYTRIRETPPPAYYVPLAQHRELDQFFFYLRTTVQPETIAPTIRREVAEVDPDLPIYRMKTMQAQVEENTFSERILTGLTVTFAGLAMLLAAIGLYGVLAFNLALRTHEIGIRMALGANAAHVRRLVAREVILTLLAGTMVGIAAAAAASRALQAFLYGLKPWDALTYGAAVAILWFVALAVAFIPTRRATRIQPMVALRHD